MPSGLSSDLIISPEIPDVDFAALTEIVNQTIDEQVMEDNARFEERAMLEADLWRPKYERALADGLIPGPDEIAPLIELDRAEAEARHEQARNSTDEFGVLRQSLPVVPPHLPNIYHNQWTNPPYHAGHADGTPDPVIRPGAVAQTGWVEMWPRSTLSGNFAWGRCSLTQMFIKKSNQPDLNPAYLFRPNSGYWGWSFFAPARFQFDAYVITVNASTADRWARKVRIMDTTRGMFGSFQGTFPIASPLYVVGQGTAAPRDYIVVTATLVARVSAPVGRADFLLSGYVKPFAIS